MQTRKRAQGLGKFYVYSLLALQLLAGALALPVCLHAQTPTSANNAVMNKAVRGQNANGIEGTLSTGVSYIANVLGPLASGGFLLHGIVAWHQGGKPMKSFVTCGALLGVSQALRLIEYFVQTGQCGVQ